MVRILLTGRTICVCQYWRYGRGQEGYVPGLEWTNKDIGLLRGVDCDILA
jgi:hypothetical protein